MLGCRFFFTKEAPEEVERNSTLLSPSSTKFLGASPDNRKALPRSCLPLVPRHFSSAAPCCSPEHDAAWHTGAARVLFCGQGTASHQHCTVLPLTSPWHVQRCTERGGKADREVIWREKLTPVLHK